jgi:O-antigen/teichoic acid export membrane protein
VRKAFISNIILLIAVNAVVKPLWVLGIDRKVQLLVGDVSFGAYIALFNISLLFHSLLDLGLTSVNNRAIASNTQDLQERFKETLGAKLVLFAFYFLVIICVGFLLHYNGSQIFLLCLAGILQAVASLLLYMRSTINGLQLFKRDALLSIADKVLALLIMGTFIYVPSLNYLVSVTNFIVVQIVCILLSVIISMWLLRAQISSFVPHLQLSALKLRIKESLPVAIAILLMFIYAKSDIVLLERLRSDGELESGIYQKSVRVLDTLNMLAAMFAGLLLGMFSRALATKQHVEDLVHTSTVLLLPVTCFVSAGLIAYAPTVLAVLYTQPDKQIVLCFRLVVSCFPALGLTAIYSTLITSANQMTLLAKIAAVGALISIVGNFIVIPNYGFLGSAGISVCTYNIVGALYFWLCNNILPKSVMWQNFRLILLCCLLATALNFILWKVEAHVVLGFVCNAFAILIFWWRLRKDEFTSFTKA